MRQKTKIWILFATTIIHLRLYAEPGVIVVPVTDVIGSPLKTFEPFKNKKQPYTAIPFAYNKNPTCCPRMHQLLFNEQVEIVKRHKDESLIEVSHFFYITKSNPLQKNTRYWLPTTAVASYAQLKKNAIDLALIPTEISFKQRSLKPATQNIVTLAMPFHDSMTHRTFSAGTRFVYLPDKTTHSTVAVHALNPDATAINIIKIPRKHCVFYHEKRPSSRLQNFVHLLKKWTYNQGFIPYVWGGCSLTSCIRHNNFSETTIDDHTSFFDRNNYTQTPKTGFDCVGLLIRAAHICGIPLFYKNTTTLATYLQPLQKHESIVAGDLIVHHGHVLAISDIKKNLVIEARGYGHGYGKVQEMPLNKIFKDIDTLQKLRSAYENSTILLRLDSTGDAVQKIVDLKIFKLESVWSKA